MFCPKCGMEIEDNANFCTRCGAPLTSSDRQTLSSQSRHEIHDFFSSTFKRIAWPLVLVFNIITCRFYMIFWYLLRTENFNKLQTQKKYNRTPVYAALCLAIASLALSITGSASRIAGDAATTASLQTIGQFFNVVTTIILIMQAFKVRAMIREHLINNDIINFNISGVMTFFFNNIYLQHKINKLMEL